MASLNFFTPPLVVPQRRVHTAATAAKGSSGGAPEKKGLLDFILGSLTKQDQFYETDPILRSGDEEKSGGTMKTGGTTKTGGTMKTGGTTSGRKGSVASPPPKNPGGGGFGGLGGLFAKKD